MSKVTLGQVATEVRESTKDPAGLPIVGLEHLIPGEIRLTQWSETSENTFTKLFHKGQVLFGRRRAYQKKAAVADFDGVCSGDITVIAAKPDRLLPDLLPFIVNDDRFFDFAMEKSAGSLSPRVKWAQLAEYAFDLPDDIEEQRSHAKLLWAIERSRSAYQNLLSQMDELVKSQFVEMFGDPRENPNGYKKVELSNVSEIMSGITKGRKPKTPVLRTVPYLCTANVQNGFLDWTETKHIDATEDEIVQYSLLADDVLMIEGGDPDKVGRGCLAGTTPEDCIFQNHVFRVRTNKAELIPQFLALYILLPSTKEYFLNCAKQTTGIATINKKQLSSLMVVCPPIAAQAEYIRFAEQADKSKYDSNLNAANTWIGGDMCA